MPYDTGRTDWLTQLEKLDNIGAGEGAVIVPAAAAGAAYEVAVYRAPSSASGAGGATVTRLSVFAAVAIVGAATNFQTLQFRIWRAGALVGTITGATTYATTASLALLTEQNLFAGSLSLQPGDVITLQSVTSGTGAALPALTVVAEATPVAPTQ